jgi:uncharacterized protein
MPLSINLRHLEEHGLHLKGDLSVEELDLDLRDELVRAQKPLQYDLEVQQLDRGLLLQGRLELDLQCQCVRCLKPVEVQVRLPRWTRHLALEGEEKAAVINDCVDLTPYVREDILLEIPQHPLCEADCGGLPGMTSSDRPKTKGSDQIERDSSAWAALDKLKF